MKIQSITILGRRWFQRSYGNTYFTADILVNGAQVGHLDRQYGYGDHYVDMATEWLEENGYIKRDSEHQPLWQLRDRDGFNLVCRATDVERQKDL